MASPAKDTKSTPEANSPYGINKELFEASTKVKNHMELVQKRLEKMEEHRSQVSEAVFFKVRTDYETQLEEIRGEFAEKCREIEGELQNLYEARTEQEAELAKHEEVLEEAKFRHSLGEYTDKKYKEIESTQNKEIKNFKELLDIIKGSIEQYEDVLGQPYQPGMPRTPKPVAKAEPEGDEAPEIEAVVSTIELDENSSTDFQMVPDHTPATGTSIPSPEEDHPTDNRIPAEDTGTGDPALEAALDQELDSFLQTEGDYFGAKEEEAAAAKPEKKTAEPEAVTKKTKSKKPQIPEDDSLSTILRDIPMEEEVGEAEAKGEEEITGAKIVVGEMPEASLLLLEGDLDEPEYILGETTSIGRSPSNDLVLKETKVSRQHCAIHFREGHFVVVDLKSANGILVNDKKVEEHYLQDGDEVRIGGFKFQFNIL